MYTCSGKPWLGLFQFQVGDVVGALRHTMIDIMLVKSKAKSPPKRFADIWGLVAVESKMSQVKTQ